MMIRLFVPGAGVEPALPKEHEFESCASTNSATRASDCDSSFRLKGGQKYPIRGIITTKS